MTQRKIVTRRFTIGDKEWELETGRIARQASGAVMVRVGGTVVLAAVTASKKPRENADFLPMTVDYRERTYAAGRIPGGFYKREAKPRDREILTSRLIDRSMRPQFPEGFHYEVQVSCVVLSSDQENTADILALVGASAALTLSDIPFDGPVGSVRIGHVNDRVVVNPTYLEQKDCDLDMVVSGKTDTLGMVESGSNNLAEEEILKAFSSAQEVINKICSEIQSLRSESGSKEKFSFETPAAPEGLAKAVDEEVREKIKKAVCIADKKEREDYLAAVRVEAGEKCAEQYPEQESVISGIFEEIVYEEARGLILEKDIRSDGRKMNEIRCITGEVGTLPRTHGSALFTRGQTQALVIVTLGSPGDRQVMDMLEEEYKERFLLHYNFPGFSVGEPKPERGPGRREIGHGALARRALLPVMPPEESFPYTIRIVSDILESNGSSSMASVCGGTLALMDAGVPVSDSVAGIAMGLVMGSDGQYKILSDIMGMEDHLGDMDFKVAGTAKGINALQMDIKIKGLSLGLLREALLQAREGRLFILEKMAQVLQCPRPELSEYTPRIETIKILPSKIGGLIGPGGKNIKKIIELSGADVDIEDDGTVFVSSSNPESMERAKKMIEDSTAEVEVGKIYTGKVVRIQKFGAFVQLLPGKDGLVHISELADHHVEQVEDVVKEGDEVQVKVLDIDNQGRVSLTCQLHKEPGQYRRPQRSTTNRPQGPRGYHDKH